MVVKFCSNATLLINIFRSCFFIKNRLKIKNISSSVCSLELDTKSILICYYGVAISEY